jgi:hypothetical protein
MRGRTTDTAQGPAIGDGDPTPRRPSVAVSRMGDRIAYWATAVGVERWARVGAVALTPVMLSRQELADLAPLFATLAAYVLVTALAPRNRYLHAADLAIAAVVIVFAGPTGRRVPALRAGRRGRSRVARGATRRRRRRHRWRCC